MQIARPSATRDYRVLPGSGPTISLQQDPTASYTCPIHMLWIGGRGRPPRTLVGGGQPGGGEVTAGGAGARTGFAGVAHAWAGGRSLRHVNDRQVLAVAGALPSQNRGSSVVQ